MQARGINKINQSSIVVGLIFLVLLIGMGIIQTGLKENPQKIMIGFGVVLLFLMILRKEKLSAILFYVLLGSLLFVTIFSGIVFIIYRLNPDAGWTEFEDERYRVMDVNWIWGLVGGLILSPLFLRKYHKFKDKYIEFIFVAIFVMTTSIIFLSTKY